VIVGAEAFFCTEIAELSCCGQSTGRLSVDVDVDPAVDLIGILSRDGPEESLQLPITQLHSSSFATARTWSRNHSWAGSEVNLVCQAIS
jgi:hypothetical protein